MSQFVWSFQDAKGVSLFEGLLTYTLLVAFHNSLLSLFESFVVALNVSALWSHVVSFFKWRWTISLMQFSLTKKKTCNSNWQIIKHLLNLLCTSILYKSTSPVSMYLLNQSIHTWIWFCAIKPCIWHHLTILYRSYQFDLCVSFLGEVDTFDFARYFTKTYYYFDKTFVPDFEKVSKTSVSFLFTKTFS